MHRLVSMVGVGSLLALCIPCGCTSLTKVDWSLVPGPGLGGADDGAGGPTDLGGAPGASGQSGENVAEGGLSGEGGAPSGQAGAREGGAPAAGAAGG